MSEPHLPPRRKRPVPGAVWALAAIGLLYGGWELVMWGVRTYVDSRIERTVGSTVVDFDLRDLDGTPWRSTDLRGRVVVLHFFRSKCVNCLAERDAIHALERRLDPARAVLLGVLLDEVQGYDASTTADTLAQLGYEHPILTADAAFVDAFHGAGWAHVTPITYIVGTDGGIVASLRGRQSFEALAAALPDGTLLPE